MKEKKEGKKEQKKEGKKETRRDEALTLDVRDAVTPTLQNTKHQQQATTEQLKRDSTCRKVLTNSPNSVEGHCVLLRIKIDAVKREKVSYSLFIASHTVSLHVAIALVSTRFTREAQSVICAMRHSRSFQRDLIPSVTSPWQNSR